MFKSGYNTKRIYRAKQIYNVSVQSFSSVDISGGFSTDPVQFVQSIHGFSLSVSLGASYNGMTTVCTLSESICSM